MMLKRLFILFIFTLVMPFNAFAASEIGKTVFARGVTTAETVDGVVRVIANDAPVYEGETLTTGEKSFVVIEFVDGTRMSLRPNTIFQLEKFSKEKEVADVHLFTGGLRASTGEISKHNPDGFKLHAKDTVTVIRDAEFDVRLCEEDCDKEAKQYQDQKGQVTLVVGRVAQVKGSLTITDKSNDTRIAVTGAPLYEGDVLQSGEDAYAVLAFRDHGRITLQAETTFKIESLNFDATKPQDGKAFFDLIEGGLRALTGAIGKQDKEDYKVNTPVATIGIRGTGFDLICVGNCVKPETTKTKQTAILSIGDGLYASVWKGAIVITTEKGQLILNKGGVVIVPDRDSDPKLLPNTPPFLDNNPAPRPDLVSVDHDNLFATFPIKQYRLGLFFALYRGHLTTMDEGEKRLDLGREEASSFDVNADGILVRLDRVPDLLREDPYFKAIDEDFWTKYDNLDENFDDYFECTIQ